MDPYFKKDYFYTRSSVYTKIHTYLKQLESTETKTGLTGNFIRSVKDLLLWLVNNRRISKLEQQNRMQFIESFSLGCSFYI